MKNYCKIHITSILWIGGGTYHDVYTEARDRHEEAGSGDQCRSSGLAASTFKSRTILSSQALYFKARTLVVRSLCFVPQLLIFHLYLGEGSIWTKELLLKKICIFYVRVCELYVTWVQTLSKSRRDLGLKAGMGPPTCVLGTRPHLPWKSSKRA